jgi:3-keto-5-aminohexanoate cleavage enzyme
MSDKIIITCAVTGAETTKAHNPALPVTPEEIADAAFDAWKAGAAVLHLHVRDENAKPTQDLAVFKKAMELVRRKCDIVIETTTGGAVGMTPEERLQPVTLEPEMASLDCGTVNFGDDYIVNTLPIMREFAREMAARKVRPTLECFDLGHVYASHILIKENLIEAPFHYGLVLNVPSAAKYEPDVLEFFVRKLPAGSHWTAMGIGGKANLDCIYGAIALGGNVRVGFEDNIYYSKGRLAASNAELVERAARIAKDCGRKIATPDDVRAMLKLRKNG